jgi:asparagine synthase (glutamine-hydrolysing)
MACHLEVRVPFLDHRVVEAGLGLPAPFTLGKTGKQVTRALYARRFGDRLARRKKQGFGVPVELWLRQSLGRACDALFSAQRLERDGLLSAGELGHGRWRQWAANDPQLLWHAFALAAWCEATQGGGPDSLREILSS